jgi:hypothetical protein
VQGGARPHRHNSLSEILRIPTDGGDVWLKAAPGVFAGEGARVAATARIGAVAAVPTVLAHTDDWWLSEPFPPARGRPEHDPLQALAAIQVASIPHLGELRRHGFRQHRLSAVAAELAGTVGRADLLGPDLAATLTSRVHEVTATCQRLDDLDLPSTVVHGDFHAANMHWVGDRWFVYDWTDAFIGHPVLDLALPLAEDRRQHRAARAANYAAAWSGVLPPGSAAAALRYAAVAGAAHQLGNYRRIIDAIDPDGGRALGRLARLWARRLLDALPDRPAPDPGHLPIRKGDGDARR